MLHIITLNVFFLQCFWEKMLSVHLTRYIRGQCANSPPSHKHTITNTHTLPSPYPPCQMYRYDAYSLPTGPLEASWECRLAGCWLCSHGNWLEPCVWPHEGHIKAGLQREREGKCPHVFWWERDCICIVFLYKNRSAFLFLTQNHYSPVHTCFCNVNISFICL